MYYPQEAVEELRLLTDIVDVISEYTTLKKKGSDHMGLCPFHNEKSASFSVSSSKQLFHCFGCGASGNVISFIMRIENYDFVDTIKYLAQRNNYTLPDPKNFSEQARQIELDKQKLRDIQVLSAKFFYRNLISDQGILAREYLSERQISVKTIKKFGLGFSPKSRSVLFDYLKDHGYEEDLLLKSGLVKKDDSGNFTDRFFNRLMFPIFDVSGKVIAFGARTISQDKIKYLNSSETPIFNKSDNLYALNYARTVGREEIILVEGYMDVLALHQAGFENTVATLGTAFTESQARRLKKCTSSVVLLFDSDQAGINATLRAIPILTKNGIRVKVLQLAHAKDPDDYIKSFGVEEFRKILLKAKTSVSFKIDCIKEKYDLNTTESKINFTTEVSGLISDLNNAIEQDVYIKEVSEMAHISEDAIKEEISKLTNDFEISKHVRQYKNRSVEMTDTVSKNIDEARRGILNLLATDQGIREKLSKEILAEEFVEPVYIKVCTIIYENKQESIYPADIVSYFDTQETQHIVSNIFVSSMQYGNRKTMQKAMNQQIKLIKDSYLNYKIQQAEQDGDINALQSFVRQKNNTRDSYITLLDG